MLLRDTPAKFGVVSIVFHWLTAAAVLTLIATGLYILYQNWFGEPLFPPDAPPDFRGFTYALLTVHLAVGSAAIPLIALRVWWRVREGHPKEPRQHPVLETITALNWPIMLVLIVTIFVSGIGLTLVRASTLEIFGFSLHPPLFPGNMRSSVPELEALHNLYFIPIHIWASLALAAIVALHTAGALKHWLIDKDGVLERMIRPGELRGPSAPSASAHGIDRPVRGISGTGAVIGWSCAAVAAVGLAVLIYAYVSTVNERWTPVRSGPLGPDVTPCVADLGAYCAEARGEAEHVACLNANFERLGPQCRLVVRPPPRPGPPGGPPR